MSTAMPDAWSARRGRRTCSSAWLFERREFRDLGTSILETGRARRRVKLDLHVVRLIDARALTLAPVGIIGPFQLVRRYGGAAGIEDARQLIGRQVGDADIHLDRLEAIVRALVRAADRIRNHAESPGRG